MGGEFSIVKESDKSIAAQYIARYPHDPVEAFTDALQHSPISDGPGVCLVALGGTRNKEARQKRGMKATPLLLAVHYCRPDVTSALIEAGANLQATTKDNQLGVLHLAAMNGDMDILPMLLEAGADIEQRSVNGYTPIGVAAQYGKLDAIAFLASSGADLNTKDISRHTLLYHGREEAVGRLLIELGVDVNAQSGDGSTPLHSVAFRYDEPHKDAILTLLLEKGAIVDAVDNAGQTALHKMPWSKALLDAGANVNAVDNFGYTPLHINRRRCDALFDCGADLEARDKVGATPLHTAAKFFNPHVAKELITEGVRTDIRCNNRQTPVEWILPPQAHHQAHQFDVYAKPRAELQHLLS